MKRKPHALSATGLAWFSAAALAAGLSGHLPAVRAGGEEACVARPARVVAEPASGVIQLCQHSGPGGAPTACGVDCGGEACQARGWEARRLIQWQSFAQGEYVGHARTPHVPEYRLRVDDQLEFVYRVTRDETSRPYTLNVGDEVRLESFADPQLTRDLVVQPDGTITVRLLGQIKATGRTVPQLTEELERLYKKFYREPSITITPLKVNTRLEDLRAAITGRFGQAGQARNANVTPEGTIQLPVVGSVQVHGLTLEETRRELNLRYAEQIEGIEVTPVLLTRAPRFAYVVGAVNTPGRIQLQGPTTALQAISVAGGWQVGANLKQVVVFRRGDDWRLLATMIDLRPALYGRDPCPDGEIWLNDSDILVVPRSLILQADDFIQLFFTRGLYGIFPFGASWSFGAASSL